MCFLFVILFNIMFVSNSEDYDSISATVSLTENADKGNATLCSQAEENQDAKVER